MIGDQPESSCCAKRWKSDGLGCFGFFFLGSDDAPEVEAGPTLPGSAAPPFTAAATVERLEGAELAAAAPLPLGSMGARKRKGREECEKSREVK